MRPIVLTMVMCLLSVPDRAWAQEACGAAYESGQEARAAQDTLSAQKHFQICAATECPDFIVSDCTKWLGELQELTPRVAIKVLDSSGLELEGATVTLDGRELAAEEIGQPLDFNPGNHEVIVAREGYTPVTKSFSLSLGETARVIAIRLTAEKKEEETQQAPPPEARKASPGVGFYVAAGVAAAGLTSFGVLGLVGLNAERNLRNDDPCGATSSCDTTNIKNLYLAADISLGVGLVSAGIATYLFISRGPAATQPVESTKLRLDFGPQKGGASALLSGQF